MSLEEAMNYQRELRDFRERVASHLEMMAAAYSAATNIPIEECQLVVETLPDKMVYRFVSIHAPNEGSDSNGGIHNGK